MGKPRLTLIFSAFLVFGFSLVVPAEDVLETTYDESETQSVSSNWRQEKFHLLREC